MTLDQFKEFNKSMHQNYNPVVESPNFKPILPSTDQIYYKDFHFLEQPLITGNHVSTL